MAAPIRGIDPEENVYLYAHKAGKYFRQRPTRGNSIVVKRSPDGTRTTEIKLRKPRQQRDDRLGPVGAAWAALAREIYGTPEPETRAKSPKVNIVSITRKRGKVYRAPSLHIRG